MRMGRAWWWKRGTTSWADTRSVPVDFQALETWPVGARVGHKHRRQVRAAEEERDAMACSCHLTMGLDDFHFSSFSASHALSDKRVDFFLILYFCFLKKTNDQNKRV